MILPPGSIARRDDLVKVKGKKEQADKGRQLQAAYQTCALSKKPLTPPIVACPLGRLYNKDALLEYLLAPPSASLPVSATPFGADGLATAGHIRSLKDVTELKLTPNPSLEASKATRAGEADASLGAARYICPISQRPMNGSVRFVFLQHCGNVVSESALKELRGGAKKGSKRRSPPGEVEASSTGELEPCSICGASYAPGEAELGHIINPTNADEIAKLKSDWEDTKAAQKAAKRAKKEGGHGGSKKRKGDADEAAQEARRATKKAAVAAAALPAAPTQGGGAPRLPASMVAALEAKKAQMAESAVASLYHKEDPNAKQDWMVRGTFKSRV